MMKRKFTAREAALLLVLTILMLCGFYYLALYRPVTLEVERCAGEQMNLEEELDYQIMKAARKKKMADELANSPVKVQGEIMPYNNIKNEITDLYDALQPAITYSLSFSEAIASGSIIRRDIAISFQVDSYEKVRSVLGRMHDSPYRCLIKNLSVSVNKGRGEMAGISAAELINVNTTVTFYETLTGAENTNGLVFEKSKDSSEE